MTEGGTRIARVDDGNMAVYRNLAQSYEGEFSALTRKAPGKDGLFALDTEPGGDVTGYLLFIDGMPSGLAAVASKAEGRHEVCEFYVVPGFRLRGWGSRFAHGLWEGMPGSWEVKQIEGAGYATRFWRKAIGSYGCMDIVEDTFLDPFWGPVTRQRFAVEAREKAST